MWSCALLDVLEDANTSLDLNDLKMNVKLLKFISGLQTWPFVKFQLRRAAEEIWCVFDDI